MRPDEPVDPDVDLSVPQQLFETVPREWDLLLAVGLGGMLGAEARYGLSRLIPRHGAGLPWATLLTNAIGSVSIGVLMVVVLDVLPPTRLVRPFLGTGLLGGFTTFSTFGVETVDLLRAHRPGFALVYVVASTGVCLLAVALALVVTARALVRGDEAERAEVTS